MMEICVEYTIITKQLMPSVKFYSYDCMNGNTIHFFVVALPKNDFCIVKFVNVMYFKDAFCKSGVSKVSPSHCPAGFSSKLPQHTCLEV